LARNQATKGTGRGLRAPSGVRFFVEVVSELRKVTWPTRQETTRLTMLVLVVSVAIGIFLGIIDIAFARLFSVVAGT
jgi:preprotein translocase subunit SecE